MRESVIYQDILQEGLKESIEQGIEQKAQDVAIKMINKGINLKIIVDVTGLTVEQVQKLQAQTEDTQTE
ncbi:MAG: hypothetical protein KME23_20055 [Goleter apudmare HA4340-LM2]|jgi:predicted transposase/invertase (TIGR01784 family)|nr:hypothetical protein [Goleter apudmare HA4340-LM2]